VSLVGLGWPSLAFIAVLVGEDWNNWESHWDLGVASPVIGRKELEQGD